MINFRVLNDKLRAAVGVPAALQCLPAYVMDMEITNQEIREAMSVPHRHQEYSLDCNSLIQSQ